MTKAFPWLGKFSLFKEVLNILAKIKGIFSTSNLKKAGRWSSCNMERRSNFVNGDLISIWWAENLGQDIGETGAMSGVVEVLSVVPKEAT